VWDRARSAAAILILKDVFNDRQTIFNLSGCISLDCALTYDGSRLCLFALQGA
jgi:hypothetical protein